MNETNDQAPAGTPAEQTPTEQSETTKSVEEELFEMPDGKKVNAATLAKEWKENFYPEYTRKSQRLSEYEKKALEMETKAEETANRAVDESEIFKTMDPNVKIALKAAFKEFNKEQAAVDAQKAQDAKLETDINTTLNRHNGKDGDPPAVRETLVKFMIDRAIYDPEEAYLAMTREIREDNLIKKALKDKGIDISTETTGGEAPKKPQGKTPKTIAEASDAALQRLKFSSE